MIKGKGASPGIAIGKALVIPKSYIAIERREVKDANDEKERLLHAFNVTRAQLFEVKSIALSEIGAQNAAIFDAHLMILEDPELLDSTLKKIESEKVNAEYAFNDTIKRMKELFESMEDSYMRERAADIADLSQRIMKNLVGIEILDLSHLEEEVILVACDLSPSETATMDRDKVLGILTNEGGMTSHTAIMARALEIPAVIGLKDITERIKTQEYVAFDGETGQVSINPSKDEIEEFQRLRQSYRIQKELAKKERGKESKTLDGRKIKLCGNIASSEELSTLIHNDAEGIGLFRTEFLYMNRAMPPSEEEQYHIYCEVLETMAPRPVVIRTLDVGGDKSIPYLNTGKEENPFLGYRAIRLCLDQTQIFRIQLKALLRASVCGNLKIMFPMISTVEELLEVKAILAQVKEEMKSDGVAFFEGTEIGMMIEVPSAALMSDILAKHVDFFSIGTNDLIQYTMAVDRNNEKIQMLYQSYNPAVLRLIKAVIDNAHKEGIWVGMCGEMAADRKIIPVLLGMGLDEFSMSPSYILSARKLINSISFQEAQVIADEVLKLSSQDEINQYLIQNE